MPTPANRAAIDANRKGAIIGVSNVDFSTPTAIAVDPTTGGLVISGSISASSASVGATGSAVPSSADYAGINVGGTLRGLTGINPAGSVYAAAVAIVDGSGNQITSFGGGTQYTDAAATVAHPTGTIPVYDNAGTIASVSTTNRLPVAIASNSSVNVNQLAGTTTDTNSGNKSAGTLRVVIATDQPQLTNSLKVDGSAVTQPVSVAATVTVAGAKTNNNAAPDGTNVGALTAIANAAAPSWTEGNLVALSTDLAGALRVTGSLSVGGTTDNSAFTAGTSTGTPAMGFFHSTIDTVTDGRAAALAIDSKRNLFTVLRDAAGNARGANVNASNQLSVSVDNTAAVTNTTQKNASPAATTMQNGATANGNGTNLAVDGYSTAIVSITASVAMSGGTTINFEASTDNTTFVAVQAINVGTNTIATTTTTTGDWQVDVTGYSFLRARISAYSAGTITVKGYPIGIVANSKVINANIVANTATNQSVNVAQLAGTTTDTNSGNKSAGTLRVVLATDQPQLTNKLLVTPDANSAINVAQIAGGNTSTVATGVQKVGIADSAGTAFVSAANALNSTGGGLLASQIIGQFDDVSPTSITENQFGNIRMSANRNIYNTIRDAAGNERGANVTASNELLVNVNNTVTVGSHAVTNAGTFAVQAAGDVASGSADSGSPVKVGFQARTSLPTAVSNAQRVNAISDKFGRQIVIPQAPRDLITTQTTTINLSSTETTVLTAVASTFLDIVLVVVINTSTTIPTRVDFRDTTGGSVIFAIYAATGSTTGFAPPIPIPQTSVNTNWTAQCSSASVTDIRIFVQAIKNT